MIAYEFDMYICLGESQFESTPYSSSYYLADHGQT